MNFNFYHGWRIGSGGSAIPTVYFRNNGKGNMEITWDNRNALKRGTKFTSLIGYYLVPLEEFTEIFKQFLSSALEELRNGGYGQKLVDAMIDKISFLEKNKVKSYVLFAKRTICKNKLVRYELLL